MFRRQQSHASELILKFDSALRDIDVRTEALLSFFNECEAKIGTLEVNQRDMEESHRLADLADRESLVIADASNNLAAIAQQFIVEAVRMGEVLGTFERTQLSGLAAHASLDDLESIADRIIVQTHQDNETLSRLADKVRGTDQLSD